MRISDWSSDVCSSDLGQAGGRNMADDRLEQRLERALARFGAFRGIATTARGVEDREVELFVIGFERQEQFEQLVKQLGGAPVAAVALVYDEHRIEAMCERPSRDHVCCRLRAFRGAEW